MTDRRCATNSRIASRAVCDATSPAVRPAHPVEHGVQAARWIDDERVFVGRADPTDIGIAGGSQRR